MGRVPITVMGFRCERCGHEWVPRNADDEPRTCPKCKSPYWNTPKKERMTYDVFRAKIESVLKGAAAPMTWTEIRTVAGLPQLFPNNQWVHKLERDIALQRRREPDGVIRWQILKDLLSVATAETTNKVRSRPRGKQGAVE